MMTGRYRSTLNTLIFMHAFALFFLILCYTLPHFFFSDTAKEHSRLCLQIWFVFLIATQTIWFHLKERRYSVGASASIILLMNVLELLVGGILSALLR
ncbi:hypothetical protein Dip510_000481 [Elusimicrobium posterum]|uniref:hypothetical protein n=1 Tax=Elusimicrobium posterum TaxID=3116653 RepID=UPI003C7891E2